MREQLRMHLRGDIEEFQHTGADAGNTARMGGGAERNIDRLADVMVEDMIQAANVVDAGDVVDEDGHGERDRDGIRAGLAYYLVHKGITRHRSGLI